MDVLLFQTTDDGDVTTGLDTTQGIETALYLSLFGGNRDDDGSQDGDKGWWGNLIETDENAKLVSETAYLLGTIPATAYNLNRLVAAAGRDLAWITSTGTAESVDVSASIEGLNMVQITVSVDGVDTIFTKDWS